MEENADMTGGARQMGGHFQGSSDDVTTAVLLSLFELWIT